jgi:hypothetical protein
MIFALFSHELEMHNRISDGVEERLVIQNDSKIIHFVTTIIKFSNIR